MNSIEEIQEKKTKVYRINLLQGKSFLKRTLTLQHPENYISFSFHPNSVSLSHNNELLDTLGIAQIGGGKNNKWSWLLNLGISSDQHGQYSLNCDSTAVPLSNEWTKLTIGLSEQWIAVWIGDDLAFIDNQQSVSPLDEISVLIGNTFPSQIQGSILFSDIHYLVPFPNEFSPQKVTTSSHNLSWTNGSSNNQDHSLFCQFDWRSPFSTRCNFCHRIYETLI